MQQSVVSMIIFLYIFISVALLFFNIIYMLSSGTKNRVMEYRIHREMDEQRSTMEHVPDRVNQHYRKNLYKKIKNEDGLLICVEALERNYGRMEEDDIAEYMIACRNAIFDTAEVYRKKEAMERALFAYFISLLPEKAVPEYYRMGEILLSYLDHSTVYCRENVLQALYTLGNENALIRALQTFQENGWYHEPKLLSDGMLHFRGDKNGLARRLWNQKWGEQMKAVLIRFMTRLEEDMSDLVLPELTTGRYELCFAAIRYFAVHINREAEPVLLKILKEDGDTAVAAAQTLGSYPDEAAKEALKEALCSRRWDVRRNSAESLMKMDLSKEEIGQLCTSEDRYAREMFIYVLESRGKTGCWEH